MGFLNSSHVAHIIVGCPFLSFLLLPRHTRHCNDQDLEAKIEGLVRRRAAAHPKAQPPTAPASTQTPETPETPPTPEATRRLAQIRELVALHAREKEGLVQAIQVVSSSLG